MLYSTSIYSITGTKSYRTVCPPFRLYAAMISPTIYNFP